MCDYSLEMYRSTPAVVGETYESRRFPSGSIGFTKAEDPHTAVCMACDMRLVLTSLPQDLSERHGDAAVVTFVKLPTTLYRDGVRFDDGSELSLQHLGPGVRAGVVDDLVAEMQAEQAEREKEPLG